MCIDYQKQVCWHCIKFRNTMYSISFFNFDFIYNHVYTFLWHVHQRQKLFPIGETLLLYTKMHVSTRSWQSNKLISTSLPSIILMPYFKSLFNYSIKFSSFSWSTSCDKTCLYSSFPSHFLSLTQYINPLSSSSSNNISYTFPPRS